MNQNEYKEYWSRLQLKRYFKRQSRIVSAVYILAMFILPIFVGSLLNSIFNFNDKLPSLQSASLALIATIGFIAYNGIQMLRTDKATQKCDKRVERIGTRAIARDKFLLRITSSPHICRIASLFGTGLLILWFVLCLSTLPLWLFGLLGC